VGKEVPSPLKEKQPAIKACGNQKLPNHWFIAEKGQVCGKGKNVKSEKEEAHPSPEV